MTTTKHAPNEQGAAGRGLTIERVFTTEGVHPYDEVTWEQRDVAERPEYAAVRADLTEGQKIGFSGVPGFLVGDTPVIGAQPADVFRQVINQELDQAGIVR